MRIPFSIIVKTGETLMFLRKTIKRIHEYVDEIKDGIKIILNMIDMVMTTLDKLDEIIESGINDESIADLKKEIRAAKTSFKSYVRRLNLLLHNK